MDWQQKWLALTSLSPRTSYLSTDVGGRWYIHLGGVEIGNGHVLVSATERGASPQEAIEKTWDRYALNLKSDEFIRISSNKDRQLRWNGFMWADT